MIVALWLVALGVPAPAAAAPKAVIAFVDGGPKGTPTVFERIAARPDLAFGLMSATQGAYNVRQTLLDMGAGTRTSRSTYDPERLPKMALRRGEDGVWRVEPWEEIVARAESAPAPITLGRLGALGASFVAEGLSAEAYLAASVDGTVQRVSIGAESTLVNRVASARTNVVVTVLSRGLRGERQLDALRELGVLLIAIRRPPRSARPQLLATGIAGLREETGLLKSSTARHPGLLAAIDVLPTISEHLGLQANPPGVRGRPISVVGERDVAGVRRLERRLRVVFPRRFPSLFAVLIAIAAAGVALAAARQPRTAWRTCSLAFMWIPFLALVGAALAPQYRGELALMGGGAVALGFLTSRLPRWAPAVPAFLGVGGYVVDLAVQSELTIRSLLGPNPRFGARFYGVGNELEAVLPPLLLVGLAAAGARKPLHFALPMVALAAALGSGRLGADVGGVITAGAAGAAATLVAAGAKANLRTAAILLAVPVVALAALIALDLVTGGDSHLTRNVADDSIVDTVTRRYGLAWGALTRGLMPLVTVVAIAAIVAAWKYRKRLYPDDRGWHAALLGGLAGGVIGALTNDSGPVLLVLGVIVLGAATAYLQGDRVTAPAPTRTL